MLHLLLHGLVPLAVALIAARARWAAVFLIMMATMLVDLDHLLADPVYDPERCSIGFHPLHQPLLFIAYAGMLVAPLLRWVGAGLLIHMGLDGLDCVGFPP